MKRGLLITALALCFVGMGLTGAYAQHTFDVVGGASQAEGQELTTGRTVGDYFGALEELTGADNVGEMITPNSNEVRYPFFPLYKNEELIGYGTWVNMIVYSHAHDMVVVVNPDSTLKMIGYLDGGSHHAELEDQAVVSRFYGMTKDRDFDSDVDVISGSTISTNVMFAELKNVLLVFDNYIKPQL